MWVSMTVDGGMKMSHALKTAAGTGRSHDLMPPRAHLRLGNRFVLSELVSVLIEVELG